MPDELYFDFNRDDDHEVVWGTVELPGGVTMTFESCEVASPREWEVLEFELCGVGGTFSLRRGSPRVDLDSELGLALTRAWDRYVVNEPDLARLAASRGA